jgi:hypothetical protein
LLTVAQARRFAPADAAPLVTFLDMLGLAFLLAAVACLAAAGHDVLLCTLTMDFNAAYRVRFRLLDNDAACSHIHLERCHSLTRSVRRPLSKPQ